MATCQVDAWPHYIVKYIIKMDKKEFILWLSLLSIHLLLCLLVQSITTILTSTLEKKTQFSRFHFKKLSLCSAFVLGTFLYKKSSTKVKFVNQKFITCVMQ